jgi:hypothetical protein
LFFSSASVPAFADYLESRPAIFEQEIDDARAGDLYLACAALTGDRAASQLDLSISRLFGGR